MKKWKFENELNDCTTTLLSAYLDTMHSKTITAIFTYNETVYAYDLTTNDLTELTTITIDKLQINGLGKKRMEKILDKSVAIATTKDFEQTKDFFPNYKNNNGYIAEFVYRMKVNNETVEQIKKSNKSKSYDLASDTKDNKQIKNLDNKATYTSLEYLLTVCKKVNYKNTEKVENAIATLKKIYEK